MKSRKREAFQKQNKVTDVKIIRKIRRKIMKRRQVIFIMTDTQRTDMLGCYGNSAMLTPNLDRLAAEGIR